MRKFTVKILVSAFALTFLASLEMFVQSAAPMRCTHIDVNIKELHLFSRIRLKTIDNVGKHSDVLYLKLKGS